MSTAERSIGLPAELPSVTVGRHFARDLLLEWNLDQLVDDVSLCTSELVTNAVRHARTALTLTITLEENLLVAVTDGRSELRRPAGPQLDPTADHGRGLQIVSAVSDDWGVVPADDGKTVWFTLRLPLAGTHDADVLTMSTHRDVSATGHSDHGGERLQADARVAN